MDKAITTLKHHIERTAFVCKCPALYEHHIDLMLYWHALDCVEWDSVNLWETYEKAARVHRRARKAVKRYVRSKALFKQHHAFEKAG